MLVDQFAPAEDGHWICKDSSANPYAFLSSNLYSHHHTIFNSDSNFYRYPDQHAHDDRFVDCFANPDRH